MTAGNLVTARNIRSTAHGTEDADLFFMGPKVRTRTSGEANVSPKVGRTLTARAVHGTNCLKKQGVLSSHEKVQAKLDDFLLSNNLLIDYLPTQGMVLSARGTQT